MVPFFVGVSNMSWLPNSTITVSFTRSWNEWYLNNCKWLKTNINDVQFAKARTKMMIQDKTYRQCCHGFDYYVRFGLGENCLFQFLWRNRQSKLKMFNSYLQKLILSIKSTLSPTNAKKWVTKKKARRFLVNSLIEYQHYMSSQLQMSSAAKLTRA